jgi:hypothetical protein
MSEQHQTYGAVAISVDNADGDKEVVDFSTNEKVDNGRVRTGLFIGVLALAMVAVVLVMQPGSYASRTYDGSFASLLSSSRHHDPNQALFYREQIVDHFSVDGEGVKSYWTHRYYKSTKYFGGPGSPIFLIVGGEGALDHGMLYPFVTEVLAKRFNAAVVQPEHRFYGPYIPLREPTVSQLLQLLTPQQAIADMLRLVTVYLRESDFRGCSPHRSSPKYCPLITIGASYPGFLSAIFRLVYPDIVDAAYASSAPLLMYAQRSDPNAYYDIVTAAAENSSPGCPQGVKTTLQNAVESIKASHTLEDAARSVGVCEDSIPASIKSKHSLGKTIVDLVSYSFSDYDMDCYPPGPDTGLYNVCQIFQDFNLSTKNAMKAFFERLVLQRVQGEHGCSMATVHCDPDELQEAVRAAMDGKDCFNLKKEFPDDSDVVVDLTAVPTDGNTIWNFQTCTDVIFLAGFSETSMFPAKNSTYDDLADWCQESFGVTPRPRELADLWGFDDLVNRGASRILFTNGGHDMWSGGSIVESLSDSLIALNFENGAHHSELTHRGPSDKDTPDIKEGFVQIADILGKWLDEIKEESQD